MASVTEYNKMTNMGDDLYFNYGIFDEITAEHAYNIASHHNDNRNTYPYYDKLALIVANNNDSSLHLYWAKNIKTHKNIIFNGFLNNYSMPIAVEWLLTVNNSRNSELKEKIIINDQVNDFIHHMCMRLNTEYSVEEFYHGLPLDHSLGVII